jgi:uracil-DNA glycosylase
MATSRREIELLRWYDAMGADEAIGWTPNDRFAPRTRTTAPPALVSRPIASAAAPPSLSAPPASAERIAMPSPAAATAASAIAAAATDLAELEAALRAFEGCALKRTATNTVFADGVAGAPLMIIGEAPGADEDRIGRPFVGRSGQLLDRMLATIGFSRQTNAYITNILFWRPPGNRKPTGDEVAACLPFVWRHIALGQPKLVVLSGGTATSALLGREDGITKLRGRWFDLNVNGLDRRVPALAMYHPSYLLRSPARKGEAWRDLLAIQARFESKNNH